MQYFFYIAATVNNTSWQFIIKKGLYNLCLLQSSEKFELKPFGIVLSHHMVYK